VRCRIATDKKGDFPFNYEMFVFLSEAGTAPKLLLSPPAAEAKMNMYCLLFVVNLPNVLNLPNVFNL
jgi:hypothetical protein